MKIHLRMVGKEDTHEKLEREEKGQDIQEINEKKVENRSPFLNGNKNWSFCENYISVL